MLQAKNIEKSYGPLNVLNDVSFSLARGAKVTLVGGNGSGKTTLLRILAGLETPDHGTVGFAEGSCLGYLPQDTSLTTDESITTYVRAATGIEKLEHEMERLADQLDNPEKISLYGSVQDRYAHLGGYDFDRKLKVMLDGFAMGTVEPSQSVGELSSGQKTKVALIAILLKGVDILLLDEPTNNLDLPALIWLEDFLKKSPAACLIVSHDRRFLDRIARKTLILDTRTHTLSTHTGTYSEYVASVAKNTIRQHEEYEQQQKEIGRLEHQAREKRSASARGERFAGSDNDKFLRGFNRDRAGASAHVAKTIEKRIERIEKVEKPFEREPLKIQLTAEKNPGVRDIELVNVLAGYQNGFRIGPLSLSISYAERIAILGLNGSGKSTLLKALTGELSPLGGQVDIGSGIRLGNLMQEHQNLDREKRPIDAVVEKTSLSEQLARAQLAKFGLSDNQATSPISALSPGSRARLILSVFAAQSVNALILDEPTNHLDLEALEALEEALETYAGTVILVSHDRDFLEKTALNATYLLEGGALTRIPDYKAYIREAEEKARKLLKLL